MEYHILCTGDPYYVLYTALLILKCSEEWLLVRGGVLLVHSEKYYVPIGDGWEEVLVRTVLLYVPELHPGHKHQVCLHLESNPGRLRHMWALYLQS